jgi:uncharacterized protein YebE (UPF0316 family)
MLQIFLDNSEVYSLVALPLLIFFARIADVSIGTLRIMFISKGLKYLAPFVGFFEILIWLIAIGQIFQNLTNPLYYIAYAGGFASGTFIGIVLESKLSIGTEIIRIITQKEATKLVEALRSSGYLVTHDDVQGKDGVVKIVYVVIDRHDLPNVVKMIEKYNPKAFYSIEDLRFVSEKVFTTYQSHYKNLKVPFSGKMRKGK